MPLAVSNIDWAVEAEEALADALRARGVLGLELDASRLVDGRADSDCRDAWRGRGAAIHALRADPADRPDHRLFGDEAARVGLLADLTALIGRAAALGAPTLCYRGAESRRRGDLSPLAARRIALPFFREVAARARVRGVTFCIEPVATADGGDFLAHGHEAAALVEIVDREGLGLALDTGSMLRAGDDAEPLFRRAARYLKHVRLAEPGLEAIGTGGVDPSRIARALARAGYAGWVSAAQKTTGDVGADRASLERALDRLRGAFGGRAAA